MASDLLVVLLNLKLPLVFAIAFPLLKMAESIGIEPIHQLPSDSLANCCLNRSANSPLLILLPYVLIYTNNTLRHANLE